MFTINHTIYPNLDVFLINTGRTDQPPRTRITEMAGRAEIKIEFNLKLLSDILFLIKRSRRLGV